MITILYAFISITLLGAFFGIGLAIAGKYLAVKKDEKLYKLERALPGVNCGACGFPGCSQYADAIFEGKVTELSLCPPGGPETLAKLGEIMGVVVDLTKEKEIAQVHCCGGKDSAVYAFNYEGIPDCNAAYSMYQGNKVCKYGCLGFGNCITVCPTNAIVSTDQELVRVIESKCISCAKCVVECPVGVIKMIPVSADYIVSCNSNDKGAATKKACKVGCIGCKICDKKSPEGGFKIDNFLATIDYSIKGERVSAVEACPSKCILPTK
ncbi:MAG: RnfABCDGE type electron transport complex subunit B [Spirochaetaceae bacterium]|nr:RnfABCDGE type electron transport complex subunit B [Spirochaetaceae bacterium]